VTRRALAAAACASLVAALGARAAGGGADVTIPARLFAPGELDVLAGAVVTWRNADSRSHTVTSDTDLFDSGALAPGSAFSRAFAATGVFPYHCTIHRSMRGVVRVYALVLGGPPRPLPPAWAITLRGVSPSPGTTVVLERIGRGAPVVVAKTIAADDGSFAFGLRPAEPASYRARAGGARSPVVRVTVKPNVAATLADARLLVSTTPKRPGSVAALQLYDRERFDWVTVAKERLDAASRASFAVPSRSVRVRAVVRGRDGWGDGTSRTLVLRRAG
jgi:plastocyanin